jgi:hypothetical protein
LPPAATTLQSASLARICTRTHTPTNLPTHIPITLPPLLNSRSEVTTFYDVQIEWDHQKGLKPVWSTSYVEDVCEFRAHVVNPSSTAGIVNITWNTKAADPPRHLIEASQAVRKLGGQRQAGKA